MAALDPAAESRACCRQPDRWPRIAVLLRRSVACEISAACCVTVGFSKKSDSERMSGTLLRKRDRHWIASNECPPSEKKFLSGSIVSCPSTSDQIAVMVSSSGRSGSYGELSMPPALCAGAAEFDRLVPERSKPSSRCNRCTFPEGPLGRSATK